MNAFCTGIRTSLLSVPPVAETTFKLSISFRVPRTSIGFLNRSIPDFIDVGMTSTQPHAGSLRHVSFSEAIDYVVGDTFVLGKTNRSVAYVAIAYLQRNPGATIYCADALFKRIKPKHLASVTTAVARLRARGSQHSDGAADETESAAYLEMKISTAYGCDAFELLRRSVKCGSKPDQPFFSTVHSVKGLEARNVLLTYDITAMPQQESVLYVAVTRAKHAVYFIQPSDDDIFGSCKKRRTDAAV